MSVKFETLEGSTSLKHLVPHLWNRYHEVRGRRSVAVETLKRNKQIKDVRGECVGRGGHTLAGRCVMRAQSLKCVFALLVSPCCFSAREPPGSRAGPVNDAQRTGDSRTPALQRETTRRFVSKRRSVSRPTERFQTKTRSSDENKSRLAG